MGRFADLLGTVLSTFRIGRATLDAAGLTASRTLTLPDVSGTIYTTGNPPSGSNHRTLLTVGSDVSSGATTNFADVTGLTFAVTAGVTYRFQAVLNFNASATTIGARFAVNGPASPTFLAYQAAWAPSTNAVGNAYDTGTVSATANLVGNIVILQGIIRPSANGTFAIRFAPETATAGGTVVKAGSTLEWW